MAGGVNGTVLGRGTYFGPLAVANHYAKKTLEKEEKLHPKYRMRVLFTYLISGSYIGLCNVHRACLCLFVLRANVQTMWACRGKPGYVRPTPQPQGR